MNARMRNIAVVIPDAVQALHTLNAATENGSVPLATLGLAQLRASQLNGCSCCVDQHPRYMKKAGETEERILAVAAWRDAPYFDAPERAALDLTEAVTRLDERHGVPDEVWDEAARHYDEQGMAALVLSIATINVWNRLNVATRQQAGHGWA